MCIPRLELQSVCLEDLGLVHLEQLCSSQSPSLTAWHEWEPLIVKRGASTVRLTDHLVLSVFQVLSSTLLTVASDRGSDRVTSYSRGSVGARRA